MPLFPLDPLFKQAEHAPKLMEELLDCHMFDYWAEKYYSWSDTLREYYPTLLMSWEELRYQVIGSDTASAYRDQRNEKGLSKHSDETSMAQNLLTMHNTTIRRMIKEVEEEVIRRKLRDF